jgi:hypothetical protein
MIVSGVLCLIISAYMIVTHLLAVRFTLKHNKESSIFNQLEVKPAEYIKFYIALVVFIVIAGVLYETVL